MEQSAQTSFLPHFAVFHLGLKPQALEEGRNILRDLSNTCEYLPALLAFPSSRKNEK